MRKATKSGPAKGRPQWLVMGDSGEGFASTHDWRARTNDGRAQLTHVASPGDVLDELEKRSYDLVLCAQQSSDDAAIQLLCQMRQHAPRIPVVFLNQTVCQDVIENMIQVATGSMRAENHSLKSSLAPKTPGILDLCSTDCQHEDAQLTLRKLWRSVEQSADALVIMDRSGVMEYVNPAFEALTGYTQREAIGQSHEILRSDQEGEELYDEMWGIVLSGNVFRGVVTDRKKNGGTIILEKTLTPLRDGSGNITHFICTGRDITERRKLESDLQQAQKMDAIGRLAGGVAHDFNHLLLVISAYAELTLESLAADHPLRRNVDEIISASRRAADLTRQLLAFGRKQMQSLQVLDLNSVIGEIAGMLPRLIGEDIELVFVPGQELGKVKVDPIQIEQVVMNLAANARDAMPDGGTLTIETANVRVDESYVQRHSIVPEGDYVLLTITDSGQGIPAEHLPHIFEPFYTTKEAGKGTGLGLATVYGIVKQNGGFVWVYSEPKLGTTFKIYLPCIHSMSHEHQAQKPVEPIPLGCETLLLVEDEASVRQASRQFLSRSGYTVLEAGDGEQALRVSREHPGPIHLMISDVVMPKMGGPRLAEWLADERPDMKVLFVSGYAENTVLQHGKIDVTSHFLQKPFSLKALARKVREVLETTDSPVLAETCRKPSVRHQA